MNRCYTSKPLSAIHHQYNKLSKILGPCSYLFYMIHTVYYLSMSQHFLFSLTSNLVSICPQYTASLLYFINDMKGVWHTMRRLSRQRTSKTMTPLLAMVILLLSYLISLLTMKTVTRLQSRI
jgi:glucan phosphoethanolaminetransferase (alkaline phosphatase superfamily)